MKKMIDSSLAKLDNLGVLSKTKVFTRAPHQAKAEGGKIKANSKPSKTKLRSQSDKKGLNESQKKSNV